MLKFEGYLIKELQSILMILMILMTLSKVLIEASLLNLDIL